MGGEDFCQWSDVIFAASDGEMWDVLSSWSFPVVSDVKVWCSFWEMSSKVREVVLSLCEFGMLEEEVACN